FETSLGRPHVAGAIASPLARGTSRWPGNGFHLCGMTGNAWTPIRLPGQGRWSQLGASVVDPRPDRLPDGLQSGRFQPLDQPALDPSYHTWPLVHEPGIELD